MKRLKHHVWVTVGKARSPLVVSRRMDFHLPVCRGSVDVKAGKIVRINYFIRSHTEIQF